jgi:hypothetical protein
LAILEHAESGALRRDAATLRLARSRRASHAFDLGLLYLRTGRAGEGRALLRRALDAGPPARRALALVGSLLPDGALPAISRMGWLKGVVSGVRAPARRIREDEPA